jgi:hypothetical protein
METYTPPGEAHKNFAPTTQYASGPPGLERPRVGRPPLGREDIHTTLHREIRANLEILRQETGFPISSLLDLAVQFLGNSLYREVARTGQPLRLAFQRMVISSTPPAEPAFFFGGGPPAASPDAVLPAAPVAVSTTPRAESVPAAPADPAPGTRSLPGADLPVGAEPSPGVDLCTRADHPAGAELPPASAEVAVPADPPPAAPPDADPAAAEAWGRLSARLKEVVGPTHHRIWLESLTPLRLEGEGLTLLVPGEHHKQELEEHFFDVIRDELAALGLPGGVFFEVRPPRDEGRGGEPNVISDHAAWEAEWRRRRAQRAGVIELNEERQKYLEALVEHALASGRQPGWVWHEFQRRYGGSLPKDVYAKVSRYMREKRPSYLSVWDPGPRD